MRHPLNKCLVGALLLAGAACSAPLAPESVLGSYAVSTAIAPVETPTHRHETLAITIEIVGERLTRSVLTRTTELATANTETNLTQVEMVYRIDGARIVTSMAPCPVNTLCHAVLISTPDYRVVPDGLIELGREGPARAFARVTVNHDLMIQ